MSTASMLTKPHLSAHRELRTHQQCYRCLRSFSSTNPLSQRAIRFEERSQIPPYPYGPAHFYKQANRGLYGGSKMQTGNKVSEQNEIKTRREWHPNIHRKRLWSDALQDFVQIRVQARVLKTMDKVGGLDEYLLGDKAARIKELGVEGWALRWKIMQTQRVKDRFAKERVKLGLPEVGLEEDEKRKKIAADETCWKLALEYVEAKSLNQQRVAQEEDAEEEAVSTPADDATEEVEGTKIKQGQAGEEVEQSASDNETSSRLPRLSTPVQETSPHRRPRQIIRELQELISQSNTSIPSLLYRARVDLRQRQSFAEEKAEFAKARGEHQLVDANPKIEAAIAAGKADTLYRAYCRGVRRRWRSLSGSKRARSIRGRIWGPPENVSIPAWRRLRRKALLERRGREEGTSAQMETLPALDAVTVEKTPRPKTTDAASADESSAKKSGPDQVVQVSRGKGAEGILGKIGRMFGGS